MIQVTKNNFESEVTNFKGVVLADFFAQWCGPCKMLGPMLQKMSDANKDEAVKYVKIDVDEEQELAARFDIMSIPTVIFFKGGKKVSSQIGLATEADYLSNIEMSKSFTPKTPGAATSVKVFSTPTCPYCTMVKSYLNEKNIKFEDIDVSKNREKAMQMVQKSGQMGVPQLWIGDQVVVGFDRAKIEEILGSK